jgi:aminomethyltransferase
MTEFAGWSMPLYYSGVIAEHNEVRTGAGLFDVSHLGKLRVSGTGSGDALQHALTADVLALEPGMAAYSLVLTDAGGTVDDVFVYRLAREEWRVVPNAANVAAVGESIARSGGRPVDEWDRWAILALQGPESIEVFAAAFPDSPGPELPLHSWAGLDISGQRGMVARTGYTGERGFELYTPADVAAAAWERLLDSGARPVGLGARDTLRLEMGYALYGHELALDVNPLEAGLGWAVGWDTSFRGKDALLEVRAAGPVRRLFGVRCGGRGVPRQGHPVRSGDAVIGEVTSGNFSPTLGTGIALVRGPRDLVPSPGAGVAIDARGRVIEGDIVKPPFIPRRSTKTTYK